MVLRTKEAAFAIAFALTKLGKDVAFVETREGSMAESRCGHMRALKVRRKRRCLGMRGYKLQRLVTNALSQSDSHSPPPTRGYQLQVSLANAPSQSLTPTCPHSPPTKKTSEVTDLLTTHWYVGMCGGCGLLDVGY